MCSPKIWNECVEKSAMSNMLNENWKMLMLTRHFEYGTVDSSNDGQSGDIRTSYTSGT